VAIPSTALASPNSPMKKSGWARCAAETAARTGSISSIALSLSPRISNSTRAERRSLAICPALSESSGERTFSTAGTFDTRTTTSLIAPVKARSPTRCELL
jgi:hypothetical protein